MRIRKQKTNGLSKCKGGKRKYPNNMAFNDQIVEAMQRMTWVGCREQRELLPRSAAL
jgi:hypothetical protein